MLAEQAVIRTCASTMVTLVAAYNAPPAACVQTRGADEESRHDQRRECMRRKHRMEVEVRRTWRLWHACAMQGHEALTEMSDAAVVETVQPVISTCVRETVTRWLWMYSAPPCADPTTLKAVQLAITLSDMCKVAPFSALIAPPTASPVVDIVLPRISIKRMSRRCPST